MGRGKSWEVTIKTFIISVEHGDYYFWIFKLLNWVKNPKVINEFKLG